VYLFNAMGENEIGNALVICEDESHKQQTKERESVNCESPAFLNNNPFCILPSLPFVF